MAVGQNQWYHFGVGAFESILVGIEVCMISLEMTSRHLCPNVPRERTVFLRCPNSSTSACHLMSSYEKRNPNMAGFSSGFPGFQQQKQAGTAAGAPVPCSFSQKPNMRWSDLIEAA